ncbi:MAG: hypoxanthine phosphoribosyltransferase, partial [Lachnospiraceae bacterium]|nr:hypoxanthine phosphoribosyltransferase [Lachnospiraceae bacterium]
MDVKIRVMIPEEEIDRRIRELGAKISQEYEGKELHMICILKGSVFFASELAKRITVPVTLDFMAVSSYGNDTVSSVNIENRYDLGESI